MKAEAMSGRGGVENKRLPVLWTPRHSTRLPSAGPGDSLRRLLKARSSHGVH